VYQVCRQECPPGASCRESAGQSAVKDEPHGHLFILPSDLRPRSNRGVGSVQQRIAAGQRAPHDATKDLLIEVGETVKILGRLVAISAIATLAGGALAGPANAHKRTITDVSSGVDEEGVIYVHAFMDPEEHAGTMKITLKKKNGAGRWVAVRTKKAPYGGFNPG